MRGPMLAFVVLAVVAIVLLIVVGVQHALLLEAVSR